MLSGLGGTGFLIRSGFLRENFLSVRAHARTASSRTTRVTRRSRTPSWMKWTTLIWRRTRRQRRGRRLPPARLLGLQGRSFGGWEKLCIVLYIVCSTLAGGAFLRGLQSVWRSLSYCLIFLFEISYLCAQRKTGGTKFLKPAAGKSGTGFLNITFS